MNFGIEILVSFEVWGVSNLPQTADKICGFHLHFQIESKWQGRNKAF